MRALEEAVQVNSHQWPTKWAGQNPLHGGGTFNSMPPDQRVRRRPVRTTGLYPNGGLAGPPPRIDLVGPQLVGRNPNDSQAQLQAAASRGRR